MKIDQVAVQLYTLRDQLQTPAELAKGLKKVRAMGYQAVQTSGGEPVAEEELLAMLEGEGLRLCATHEDGKTILSEPEIIAERLNKFGCQYTAYPFPEGVDFTVPAQVEQLAKRLDHAGRVLHEAGKVLTYHNHAIELMRFGPQTLLEYIYQQTDARYLQAEIDTYWIQYGGGDPAQWCTNLAGRLPLLHMKDYEFTPENRPQYAEIGSGNLDWKRIIAAAEGSGCQWFIVEQDSCAGDPFVAIKKSFDHIKEHLC